MLGTWPVVVNMNIDFLVVNAPSNAYNAMQGKMSLNKVRVIALTPHLLMKFLMTNGISQVQADQIVTKWCYMANLQNLP